ncbi:glycosyltransferase family 2 protein [Haloarcula sp. GH36]|uniref:glycosyltransferase family 2 protein n=1 Tax=Haloarcula montana TaxID=3111776 RepID=UPI002D7A27AB|nr:glycosyltransferase family A protein [Haloarcula sp. GH36]
MSVRVSVVVPTYNRPDLLSRALDSVLTQTVTDLECIVIDDCSSTSQARKVVESTNDDRVRYARHEETKGSSAARNTGIEMAVGEYVAFLDDDDEWYPEKLERQLSLFEELTEEYGIVYCWMNYYDDTKDTIINRYRPRLSGDIFPDMLDGQRIGSTSTLVVRRPVAETVNGFDENLIRGTDGDFIRRICRNYKVEFVPDVLVRYHVDHGHTRVTRFDREGIEHELTAQHAKLKKFPDALDRYPRRKANVYAGMAANYGDIGEWEQCLRYYQKALRASLRSRSVYWRLFRSVKRALQSAVRGIWSVDRDEAKN